MKIISVLAAVSLCFLSFVNLSSQENTPLPLADTVKAVKTWRQADQKLRKTLDAKIPEQFSSKWKSYEARISLIEKYSKPYTWRAKSNSFRAYVARINDDASKVQLVGENGKVVVVETVKLLANNQQIIKKISAATQDLDKEIPEFLRVVAEEMEVMAEKDSLHAYVTVLPLPGKVMIPYEKSKHKEYLAFPLYIEGRLYPDAGLTQKNYVDFFNNARLNYKLPKTGYFADENSGSFLAIVKKNWGKPEILTCERHFLPATKDLDEIQRRKKTGYLEPTYLPVTVRNGSQWINQPNYPFRKFPDSYSYPRFSDEGFRAAALDGVELDEFTPVTSDHPLAKKADIEYVHYSRLYLDDGLKPKLLDYFSRGSIDIDLKPYKEIYKASGQNLEKYQDPKTQRHFLCRFEFAKETKKVFMDYGRLSRATKLLTESEKSDLQRLAEEIRKLRTGEKDLSSSGFGIVEEEFFVIKRVQVVAEYAKLTPADSTPDESINSSVFKPRMARRNLLFSTREGEKPSDDEEFNDAINKLKALNAKSSDERGATEFNSDKIAEAKSEFELTFDLLKDTKPFKTINAAVFSEAKVVYWGPKEVGRRGEIIYKITLPKPLLNINEWCFGTSVWNAHADVVFDRGASGFVDVSLDQKDWKKVQVNASAQPVQTAKIQEISDLLRGSTVFFVRARIKTDVSDPRYRQVRYSQFLRQAKGKAPKLRITLQE